MLRSKFSSNLYVRETDRRPILAIIDSCEPGSTSVTNDVENVISHFKKYGLLKPGTLVVYRDTEKNWDQILWEEASGEIDFRFLRTTLAHEAVERAR